MPRQLPDGAKAESFADASVVLEDLVIMLNSVLVATDFGDTSRSALEHGRYLARSFGARLHVVHVAARVLPLSAAELDPTNLEDLEASMVESATRQLDALLTDEDRNRLNAEPMVLISTAPADAITEYARKTHVDIIVVGTHGRGGISHLLMGSVAEHVVRHAPCPVMVVRPHEHEFIAPDAVTAATTP